MLLHELDDTGCPNASETIQRGDSKVWDRYIHDVDGDLAGKTLIAYELDDDGTQIMVVGCDVEGRFYSDTDDDYEDLSVGHVLSAAPSNYERYLIRVTADAGTLYEDKHIQFRLV